MNYREMGHGQKYGQRNNREAAHPGVGGQRLNAHFQGNGQLTRKKIDPYPAGIRETGLQISAGTEPHIRWGSYREGLAIAGQKPSAEDEFGQLEFLRL